MEHFSFPCKDDRSVSQLCIAQMRMVCRDITDVTSFEYGTREVSALRHTRTYWIYDFAQESVTLRQPAEKNDVTTTRRTSFVNQREGSATADLLILCLFGQDLYDTEVNQVTTMVPKKHTVLSYPDGSSCVRKELFLGYRQYARDKPIEKYDKKFRVLWSHYLDQTFEDKRMDVGCLFASEKLCYFHLQKVWKPSILASGTTKWLTLTPYRSLPCLN